MPQGSISPAPDLTSRRGFLRAAAGAGLILTAGLTGGCDKAEAIDILAPPSTLRPELLRMFEEQSGIQVRPSSWISPTDALGKLFASSARADMMIALSDLFTPVAPDAVKRGLLRPMAPAEIPDSAHVSPQFRADMFSAGGRIYSVPIYWGYDTILYNRKAIHPADPLRDSWGLIFDDRFRGKVSLKDDAHESIMPTALYLGHANPQAMDRADLREVTRFLVSKKRNFRALWSKFAEAVQLMATGEVNALYGYPLMLQSLRQQGVDVAAARPKEGVLIFVQSAFIPSSAANPEGALKWINFLLREDIGHRLTEEAAVLSPSDSVRNRFSAAQQREFGYDILNGAKLVRLGRPENLQWWVEAWAEFKAA
jgi:spermidine/putrescine-binding protein